MKKNETPPSAETVFTNANRLLESVAPSLREEGQDFNMRGMQIPHFPVQDTALAACLATLDIPLRDPAPFTEDVALDEKGNVVTGETILWWLSDVSRAGGAEAHKTEELASAWMRWDRFKVDFPMHPMIYMREAIDARSYWIQVIHSNKARQAMLPTEIPKGKAIYETKSIHAASVLKACGFTPLAFEGGWFALEQSHQGVAAAKIIATASLPEGQMPQQWMSKVLYNLSQMLGKIKSESVTIRQRIRPGTTLMLRADADTKTRDKFHALT